MTGWQSGAVDVAGLRLHYTRTGGDLPPLIAAHGIGDDGLCWAAVAEALAPAWDVIMVDARGHGRSEAPLRGYGPAEHAADLRGLVAALGLRQPVVLGHSMGAMTTLMLAGSAPDVPRAILLEDPPPVWLRAPGAAPGGGRSATMHQAMAELKRKTRAELIAGQRAVAPAWPEQEIERWADSKIRFSPNILSAFSTTDTNPDWPSVLHQVRCPALLLTGDPACGALVSPEDAASLRAHIPHVQVARIAGGGHSMRHDQLTLYLDAVRAFLATLA
jgi:pimeloyl-ACP methyl ester carboxylesterase